MSTLYNCGYVVDGSYTGYHVYDMKFWKNNAFMIVKGDKLPLVDRDKYGTIEYDNLISNTQFQVLEEISKDNVVSYDIISSIHKGVNGGKLVRGAIIAGPIGAMVGGTYGMGDLTEVLIRFKNGKESIVCFDKLETVQKLQRILYGLNKTQDESANESINNKTNEEPLKQTANFVPVQVDSNNFNSIIERIYIFLEDGEWEKADYYCEQALNFNPKCGTLYLAKLMAELKVSKEDNLKYEAEPFDESVNAIKASKYDPAIAEKIKNDNNCIRERNEESQNQVIYEDAVSRMKSAMTNQDYILAAGTFLKIKGFKDADKLADECFAKAYDARQDETYGSAMLKMSNVSIESNKEAIKLFESIIDWKDSRTKIDECNAKIKDIKIAEEKAEVERKRKEEEARIATEKKKAIFKKIAMIGGPVVALLIIFLIILNTVILPASNYKKALAEADAGNYSEAYSLFNKKPDYKDTKDQIAAAKLKEAKALIAEKKYDLAYAILEEIGDKDAITENMYARASEYLEVKDYDSAYALFTELGDNEKINESLYNRAVEFINAGNNESAYEIFSQISDYKDSNTYILSLLKDDPKIKYRIANVGDIVTFGKYYQSNSETKEDIEWRVLAQEDGRLLVISEYALDCKQYNIEETDVTWETCSLRKWLNDTFLKTAFGSAEKSMIESTLVTADENPNFNTDPGNDTTDKVFLLSYSEAQMYFNSTEDRVCNLTAYAKENGALSSGTKDDSCLWWLRSPGLHSDSVTIVHTYGEISSSSSYYVDASDICVRPAMWIEI